MFNVTPFHTLEEELPKVITPILPEGIIVKFDFGRFIAKKGDHVLEETLMVDLARSGSCEGFVTALNDFLQRLAAFISKAYESEYPKLNDEVATFQVELEGEQVIIGLITKSAKYQRLGHVTYKSNYAF